MSTGGGTRGPPRQRLWNRRREAGNRVCGWEERDAFGGPSVRMACPSPRALDGGGHLAAGAGSHAHASGRWEAEANRLWASTEHTLMTPVVRLALFGTRRTHARAVPEWVSRHGIRMDARSVRGCSCRHRPLQIHDCRLLAGA